MAIALVLLLIVGIVFVELFSKAPKGMTKLLVGVAIIVSILLLALALH